MATAQIVSDLPASKATYNVAHPLCPLTASEISRTADLVQSVWPSNVQLRYKVITLLEPAKKDFLPYLDAEHNGSSLPQIARKAFVAYYIRNTVRLHEYPWPHMLTMVEPLPRSRHQPIQ